MASKFSLSGNFLWSVGAKTTNNTDIHKIEMTNIEQTITHKIRVGFVL